MTSLKEPISLGDLIKNGTTFEFNVNFEDSAVSDMFDEIGGGSDDENESLVDSEMLIAPWTKSFDELRQKMEKVNENIYKRVTKVGDVTGGAVPINARVEVRYSAYWENDRAPFDSTYLRGQPMKFCTGQTDILPGFHAAVQTMCSGEHAQFVISYKLLYQELGCPPRIKPRADALFIIELVSFHPIGDLNAELSVPEEDRNKYAVIIGKIKQIHVRGVDYFNQGFHKNAIIAFEKAKELLLYCRLSNDEEEREQTEFLIKLYTNLAVCYLKINAPTKTCLACKEIRRLNKYKPHLKSMFQEARALSQLGEYQRARDLLTQAQTMAPFNKDITKELVDVDQRYARYKKNEKEIWQRAIGLTSGAAGDGSQVSSNVGPLEKEMAEIIKSFKDDVNIQKFPIPGIGSKDMEVIEKLANQFDLMLDFSPINQSYTLRKK